jgi:mono/diheme cytochrome c family protein
MSAKPVAGGIVFLLVVYASAVAQNKAQIERGKYLVESVAVCQDCHTPKLENGELDRSKWMKGADLAVTPIKEIPRWHKAAPDISATSKFFKTWGEEGIVNFLQTGKNPKGGPAGPPMPSYRLSREDALAIVEYLKSLQ